MTFTDCTDIHGTVTWSMTLDGDLLFGLRSDQWLIIQKAGTKQFQLVVKAVTEPTFVQRTS